MSVVLSVERLSVRYGGVQALREVSLDAAAGTLTALIGPNGAGKTTFVDAVTGFTRARGRVTLVGEDISSLPPHARARRGLCRTFQTADLFVELTVQENLTVAASPLTTWKAIKGIFAGRAAAAPGSSAALALLGIEDLADRYPDELTQGQRTLVGVARAIAPRPALVLLDEPAAGLDARESQLLGEHLRRVVDGGIPILLIDHDMNLVLRFSDHVVVLDFGDVIGQGRAEAVAQDPRVVEAYLGHGGVAAVTT